MRLSQATFEHFVQVFSEATAVVSSAEYYEQAMQALVGHLYRSFAESAVLVRGYVTVPLAALPEANAEWVRQLARAKDIEPELTPATQVISLVGSAGREPEWHDRRSSKGHVGIPMTSASFIDAIPMMSRLLASLGGNLKWIDERESSHVISRLGNVAGIFYVADARSETDAQGRKVISATEFVEQNGVRTVFGLGGAYASGQLVVLLVFLDEFVPSSLVDQLRAPFLRFKAAAGRLLSRVFVQGGVSGVESAGAEASRGADASSEERSPGTLAEALAAKSREFDALNALYLELESQLENRTRSLRLILDSTGDGMLVVNFDGSLTGECTSAVTRWFGMPSPGVRVGDFLFGAGSVQADAFQVGLEQIGDDVLPFEVNAQQMPVRLGRAESTFELGYRQVFEKDRCVRVLLVIRDITAALAAERAEAQARELQAIVANILRDRRDFQRFMQETQLLLDAVAGASELATQKRQLHTLKGNTAIYGFHRLATLVHRVEGEFGARARLVDGPALAELRRVWQQGVDLVSEFVSTDESGSLEIRRAEYDDFLRRLTAGEASERLSRIARSWRHEPTGTLLRKLGAQARRLGEQLGKPVDVLIKDAGGRVPLERTQGYWSSLVHLVRNALDHGIEMPDERESAGKPAAGRITLECSTNGDWLVVSLTDDGRGVSWDAVRGRARALGLPAATQQDLVAALLTDGLSTRSNVSELSGRGVGLAALQTACKALDGGVEVESTLGLGTTVSARVSLARLLSPSVYPGSA